MKHNFIKVSLANKDFEFVSAEQTTLFEMANEISRDFMTSRVLILNHTQSNGLQGLELAPNVTTWH